MVWKDADGTERGVDNAAEGDVSDEAGEVGHKAVRIDAGFHLFNTSHHLLLISVYDGLGGPGRPPLLRRYSIFALMCNMVSLRFKSDVSQAEFQTK